MVFDFDGTLAHLNIDFTLMAQKIHELMAVWGVDYRLLKARYALEQIQECAHHFGDSWENFREQAIGALLEVEMEAACKGALLPGVRSMLRRLRGEGIKVGVITRNCRQAVLRVAPDLETDSDAFVSRDDTDRVKPDPGHLQTCLALLELGPANAVMIGDHVIDVHSGRAVGMHTIGVLTGNTPEASLKEAGADLVVGDATELAHLLELGDDD